MKSTTQSSVEVKNRWNYTPTPTLRLVMLRVGTNFYIIHFNLLGIDPENLVYVEFENQHTIIIPKDQ